LLYGACSVAICADVAFIDVIRTVVIRADANRP
jgi:hypothetical protein